MEVKYREVPKTIHHSMLVNTHKASVKKSNDQNNVTKKAIATQVCINDTSNTRHSAKAAVKSHKGNRSCNQESYVLLSSNICVSNNPEFVMMRDNGAFDLIQILARHKNNNCSYKLPEDQMRHPHCRQKVPRSENTDEIKSHQ